MITAVVWPLCVSAHVSIGATPLAFRATGLLSDLPSYPSITVSGQSAGASAALQHAFAFSSIISGLTIATGSPYGCGVQQLHGVTCYFGPVDAGDMLRYARRRFEQGLIDDPRHLKDMPVLLFSGSSDYVVLTRMLRYVTEQLSAFKVRPPVQVFNTSASHVWSVDHGSCGCGACWLQNLTGMDTVDCCNVNNCDYDLSGDMMRTFFGERNVKPRAQQRKRGIHWIEQWNYLPPTAGPPNRSTMLRWAPVYVPRACEGRVAECAIHVNYHGCTKNPPDSSDSGWHRRLVWVRSIDINSYAESNRIVVLYPQAAGSDSSGEGCFNWASYEDDPLFDTRYGVQLNTVMAMLADLPTALANSSRLVRPGEVPQDPPTLGYRM